MHSGATNGKQQALLDDDRADVAAALQALCRLWDQIYTIAHRFTVAELDRMSDDLRVIQGAVLVAHKHLQNREPKG